MRRPGALSTPVKLLIGALVLSIIAALLISIANPTIGQIGSESGTTLDSVFTGLQDLLP